MTMKTDLGQDRTTSRTFTTNSCFDSSSEKKRGCVIFYRVMKYLETLSLSLHFEKWNTLSEERHLPIIMQPEESMLEAITFNCQSLFPRLALLPRLPSLLGPFGVTSVVT